MRKISDSDNCVTHLYFTDEELDEIKAGKVVDLNVIQIHREHEECLKD